jgi:hypothetical protein
MVARRLLRGTMATMLAVGLAGCGNWSGFGSPQVGTTPRVDPGLGPVDDIPSAEAAGQAQGGSTIWSLFSNADSPNTTVEVNRYLWNAALEVLDFLPIQTVDPFSGVIVTGFGTPPGGGRAFRAAVLVNDPALDARSLNVALMTSAGPASAATIRAVEDAILTRARQLRARDARL